MIFGNLGNETVYGGVAMAGWGAAKVTTVHGGAGGRFRRRDRGADTMFGGAGADRFHSVGEAGIDRIEDFNFAEGDRLNLPAGTTYTLTQSGADTVVNMGGGGMVILVGVQMSSLPGDWLTVG
ncbi:hypothetical protein LRS10_19625 [Phenylobacterium sp. J426]|uniref:hypothetical protein n=1 Tax=Phenylobacterium sp. J426 TaxID=2898439 RepID=UPI002151C229|nr:hypothetical protein [Phenylobacterium sp. J426]MCR5876160.1 hypothetical protein [Phenylobacterium sp. J426]